MRVISHRGNIKGVCPEKENRPSYIDCAIGNGYDVEIDARVIDGEIWLGHDYPQYKVSHKWIALRQFNLWIHCKNYEASVELNQYNSFSHSIEPFVFTSNGKIWLHDLNHQLNDKVIIPLLSKEDLLLLVDLKGIPYGICTDYPSLL